MFNRHGITHLRRSLMAFAAVFAMAHTAPSMAQPAPYPNKPVRFIIPFAPGGGNDIIGRAIAAKLTDVWKQQMVVARSGRGCGDHPTDMAGEALRITLWISGVHLTSCDDKKKATRRWLFSLPLATTQASGPQEP